MNFLTLLNSVKDGDVFIELYGKYSVDSPQIEIPLEYTNTIFYIIQYIKKAFEYNQLKTVNYLLNRIDKRENNIFEFVRCLITQVNRLEHIEYIIKYLKPNHSVIERLILYHLITYEDYINLFYKSFWNKKSSYNPSILLDVIELFMNIYKPPYTEHYGIRYIGKLILSRYYTEINSYECVKYWTNGLKNNILRKIPNKDMLKLLEYSDDFYMEFFKVSNIIVPKSHSLYPKYIEYHKPKIIYTKKIWELIGVSINSDVIA